MNLYLIKEKDIVGYDEYDSAVVVAADEETAKLVNLKCDDDGELNRRSNGYKGHPVVNSPDYCNWKSPIIQFLGKADKALRTGVICASYNAG